MFCVSGTLTQNEMVFKRLHLGTVAYGLDSMDEVQSHIFSVYTQVKPSVLIPKVILKNIYWHLYWEEFIIPYDSPIKCVQLRRLF